LGSRASVEIFFSIEDLRKSEFTKLLGGGWSKSFNFFLNSEEFKKGTTGSQKSPIWNNHIDVELDIELFNRL